MSLSFCLKVGDREGHRDFTISQLRDILSISCFGGGQGGDAAGNLLTY